MIKLWTAKQQADFGAQLAACRRAVLFFDYDGTLAPLVSDRDAAFPYPGVRDALEKLLKIKHCRVVLVSGRRAAEIQPLLQSRVPFEAWGAHGAEHLRPTGALEQIPISDTAQEGLQQAAHTIQHLLGQHEIERKPNSVAAHFTKLPPEIVPQVLTELEDIWQPISETYGLELMDFHLGIEMRVPGINKARAIHAVMEEEPSDAVTFYIGDDLTDEDAFQALSHSENTVLIGREKRPSAAKWLLPEEPDGRHIVTFLNETVSAVSR